MSALKPARSSSANQILILDGLHAISRGKAMAARRVLMLTVANRVQASPKSVSGLAS
jgi:hypothetical protein